MGHGSVPAARIGLALLVAASMHASPAHGEESCTRLIGQVVDAYKIGRFDEVLRQTAPCLGDRTSFDERQRALALRANVYLAIDDIGQAESAVTALLEINPEFTPAVDDLARFRSLVERLKRELSIEAISSVSKMSESLLEAPATVVVVTAEQIRRRGYLDVEAVLHGVTDEAERRDNARRPEHWQRRELTLSRKKSRGRRRR